MPADAPRPETDPPTVERPVVARDADEDARDDDLVRGAAEAIGAAVVAVLELEGDGDAVVTAAWPSDAVGRRMALSGGAIARALAGAEARRVVADRELADLLGGGADGDGATASIATSPRACALCCVLPDGSPPIAPAQLALVASLARTGLLERRLAQERRAAQESAARLGSLVDAGMALAGELSLDELLSRLVRTAREVVGARYAALAVLNADRTALSEFLTSGLSDEERAAIGHVPRGRGILGALIRDARPLRLERISDDPRSVGFPVNHPPMESFLGVPVALRGEVFGNLYLTEKVGGAFTADDEQMALTLAAQAAVALDNARRYQAERRRADELESVHEVARAVLGTLEVDQLLPLIARRARHLTGAGTVAVALAEGEGMVFRYAHGVGSLAVEGLAVPADPERLGEHLGAALGAESVEVAPLEIDGHVVGVLAAAGEAPFDAAARRLLATFSSQAAIALTNAQAFAEERERLMSSAQVQAARAREHGAAESLRRVIEAQEAERARIALELHDEAGQVMTALALHLRALEEHVVGDVGRGRLAELRALANGAAGAMREMATRLRPSGLREHGLASALERQAARLRESGVAVDVAVDVPARLPEEIEIAVFRVVQEALTNVARHAGADHASVVVTAPRGRLRVVVEDDGRGFDPAAPTDRLGLAGLHERVELTGGRLRIESSPGAGTAVIVDMEVHQ